MQKIFYDSKKIGELIHAIIKHGDFADKAFLEETLHIKFVPSRRYLAYKHIPEGGYYLASMPNDMSDAPIVVSLNAGEVIIGKVTLKPELYSEVAFTDLDRVGAVFHNCKYLTRKQIDPDSEAVIRPLSKYDMQYKKIKPSVEANWSLGKVGKEGSEVNINYSFRPNDADAVEYIIISQHAETHLRPVGEDSNTR